MVHPVLHPSQHADGEELPRFFGQQMLDAGDLGIPVEPAYQTGRKREDTNIPTNLEKVVLVVQTVRVGESRIRTEEVISEKPLSKHIVTLAKQSRLCLRRR